MWTYKEGTWLYWSGTLQADRFIGDGSQLTGIPGTGSETDPIFIAASGSLAYIPTGTETEPLFIAASGSYLTSYTETDPVFIASSGSFLQSYTETDPIFIATSNALSYVTAESDPIFIATSAALAYIPTGTETEPVFLAASNAYLTSYSETDPIFIATSNALGYVTAESDPIFIAASGAYLLNTGDTGNGDYTFNGDVFTIEATASLADLVLKTSTGNGYKQTFRVEEGQQLAWHWGDAADEDKYFSILLGGGQNRIQTNNRDLNIYTSSSATPAIFVESSNSNVGIGTSSPNTTLEVNGIASAAQAYLGINEITYSDILQGIAASNAIIASQAQWMAAGDETDPIFNGASGAMNTQISSSSNAIIASGASWTGAVANGLQGVAASNAIVASKAQWMTFPSNSAGIAASNAVTASAAVWQAAVTNYPQGIAASNAIIAHAANASNPHGTALTQTNLVLGSGAITTDNDASGAAVIRNILIGTEATPGPANLYTQGTVYLKYTA